MHWLHQRKKFEAVDCVHKIMATDFSDARDVLLDFLSRDVTVIAAGYCNMLGGLKEAEKLKKIGHVGSTLVPSSSMTMWHTTQPGWLDSGSSGMNGMCCSIHHRWDTRGLPTLWACQKVFGSSSRKIIVLLWCLLAPCTWHFFVAMGLIHKFLAGLNASVEAVLKSSMNVYVGIYYWVLLAVLQWQFVLHNFSILVFAYWELKLQSYSYLVRNKVDES